MNLPKSHSQKAEAIFKMNLDLLTPEPLTLNHHICCLSLHGKVQFSKAGLFLLRSHPLPLTEMWNNTYTFSFLLPRSYNIPLDISLRHIRDYFDVC